MYDHGYTNYDYLFWKHIKKCKVINFSSTLHKKLIGMGLHSMYLQYFPPTPEFTPGKVSHLFFWQRRTNINIHIIDKIINGQIKNLFIHKALDPHNYFIPASDEQKQKYNIVISDWFENKSDLETLINACGIYIAPRLAEGIGISYLEAMSLGKLIIAHDAPAMNEYIHNGINGILADFTEPSEIIIENIEQMQSNAYEYCKKGREQWLKNRKEIINFIEQNPSTHKRYIMKKRLKKLPFKIIRFFLPYGIVQLLFHYAKKWRRNF